MISILLGPRLVRSARKLSPESRRQVEAVLSAVARHFGEPHRHSGLGLRKLAPDLWECRVDLQRRILFIQEPARLKAYDIMNHDEIRAWLKHRPGY
jgi:hypothetical protein